jgi:hypothetical protein
MNRILSALIPIAALFFWNKFASAPASDVASPQASNVSKTQFAVAGFLGEKIAGAPLSEQAVSLILPAAVFFSAIVGFLCHFALEDRAFGPRINGVLSFFGAAIAIFGWVLVAPKAYVGAPASLLMVGSVGAVALLLLFALIKVAIVARFDEAASGARPVSSAPKAVSRQTA